MARTVKPLTHTQIDKAKPKDKEYNLSDGQGLQLRIKPNGTKIWLLNYCHPKTKKRNCMSFGTYPTIGLSDARALRDDARKLLANNIDPKEHKLAQSNVQQRINEATLQAVSKQWLAVKSKKVTFNYAEDIARSLELHIFPNLGSEPIAELRPKQVIAILQPVAAKGNFETIKRLCQRINEIMIFAVNTGVIEFNPLNGIKAAFESPQKKNMPTIPPAELPRLISAIFNASIKITTRNLILWQLHTMTRPSEAAGTCWAEIDFDKAIWTIPAERMKKGKEHVIPLTDQSIALLKRMQAISGNQYYVFPSDRQTDKHINAQTANMALKRMGFEGQLVAHGLRALASTTLNEEGFDPDVIESALAHIDKNEVRRAYNRATYLDRRREMMIWWSGLINRQTIDIVNK
ncbi:integrase domain-containing protein [Photobacterium carnosum]|uniref:integrase domain-containing protein n=1 Tax=Photobacterium carnosum TaxID=2023717 RepID=UPI001E3BB346|nr:integrase domain-containing protein [Photobacterium carnosum]MCD9494569.1 tyrosine-type recombinase/integrase [Photobacterium carnosum]